MTGGSVRCAGGLTIVAVAVIALGASSTSGDEVVRRGGLSTLRGDIVVVDEAGVSIRSELGAMHIVPWDRIREVDAGGRPLPELDRYMARAEKLWRARSRVERLDMQLAEPLFEELFEHYRGRTHETALVAAEGLLRCRLARGANDLAVVPALEVARLRRADVTTRSYGHLDAVYDVDTGLWPQLPPFWTGEANLERLIGDLDRYDARRDAGVARLADLYRWAARQQLGEAVEPPASDGEASASIELLRQMIGCVSSEDDVRRESVAALEASVGSLTGWRELWAHFFIGVGRSMDDADGRWNIGHVHLAHLPARASRSQPYLAGVAIHLLAETARNRGDDRAATNLDEELRRLYPHHPLHVAGAVIPAFTDETRTIENGQTNE